MPTPNPTLEAVLEAMHRLGLHLDDRDRCFIADHLAIYRSIHAQTPQWLGTLHVAFRTDSIACTPSALGNLKARLLATAGAGDAAWRLVNDAGDALFKQNSLALNVANLVSLLRLAACAEPPALPDIRVIDALCEMLSDPDDWDFRQLPAVELLPSRSVVAAAMRAARRIAIDYTIDDYTFRMDLREVFAWAHGEPAVAEGLAQRVSWPRLVARAADWLDEQPGTDVPSALPLHVRAGDFELIQLRTPVELAREALRMKNCLGSANVSHELAQMDRAFFSIRCRSRRRPVADLGLAYQPRLRRWAIDELKAWGNGEPSPDVCALARALCASVSPRLQLHAPRSLPAAAEQWAAAHPGASAARLAARFAMMIARADAQWFVPYITRRSHHAGAFGIQTRGDELLTAWRAEFARCTLRPGASRLLRLPTDGSTPHCVFDVGAGPRAIAFRADRDGRLASAQEVFDADLLHRWARRETVPGERNAEPMLS
jgi:hypothetical protein